jgi:aspartyl-tRNA(Asn)/glutamyl-tRNA(Gln) amidotransferase subunit A
MTTNLTELTIAQALDGLKAKKFTALELTNAHLAKIDLLNPSLNAFVLVTHEVARAAAAASDARYANGTARALEGIPMAIKDMFCTKGIRTTACSNILAEFVPPYESTVTQKLLDAGAVFLGKTNQDEFAMGSSTTSGMFGPTVSPWRKATDSHTKLVAGGSSGGSAVAVSAHMAMGATGTDTGGSIRQPASYCGITGIKPTYGRCSRWGIIAFASSLDQAGVFGRTVDDCARQLQVIAGHDPRDSTSADMPVPDFAAALTGDIKGLRVGIPREYRVDNMPKDIDAMWQQGIAWMKDAGATIVDVSLPHTKYALPTYYIIAPAETSSNMARYDGVRYGLRVEGKDLNETYELSRGAGFHAEVKRRIIIGTYVLSAGFYDAYYTQAQKVRRKIYDDFMNAYQQCDVLLAPTTPSGAFPIGENEDDPVKMYLNDVFTVPASLAGLPDMSVPAGLDKDGLPLGLQIIGRPWDEATVMRAAGVLERAAAFSAKPQFAARAA